MNIEYNKHKAELRDDPLVDALSVAKEFVGRKSRELSVGAVAVLIVVVGILVFLQVQAGARRKADEAFGKALAVYTAGDIQKSIDALTDVANEYKGTPHAAYSAYVLGSALVQAERFDEAIDWFEVASKGSNSAGFIPAAAIDGLSIAYEGKGDFEQALSYGRKALADKRISYRHAHLRWRMALLSSALKDNSQAIQFCSEIVSDTLAVSYHQKAKNLVAELKAGTVGG